MTLPWTWEEINSDWLLGSKLAASPEEIVSTFTRVEQAFGREWMESSRLHSGGRAQGTSPTLHIVTLGQRIACIDGVLGARELLERLRQRDESASAELTAVYLLRSSYPDTTAELGPTAKIGERHRKPDFRVMHGDDVWTYVEVTQPDVSETQKRAETVLNRLSGLVKSLKKSFALEVFLRREPTDSEIDSLAKLVPMLCLLDGVHSQDLGGLGRLFLNHSLPGQVVLQDHEGEENAPRLGCVKAIYGPDEPHRHISVRMAFADDRANDFLRKEAKQLPKDAPGLIMVRMAHAPGGFKAWEPLLQRRFQPSLHTRVSGVCLFQSWNQLTTNGEAWMPTTKLLLNPNSRFPLPEWVINSLTKFQSERLVSS
jgi:hypothetical protein